MVLEKLLTKDVGCLRIPFWMGGAMPLGSIFFLGTELFEGT